VTVIQLPDEQAAALRALAAAQDLTLEDWLGRLAGAQNSPVGSRRHAVRYELNELLAQCDSSAAQSPEDQAWLSDPPMGREAL
jgi:hypothetical protein